VSISSQSSWAGQAGHPRRQTGWACGPRPPRQPVSHQRYEVGCRRAFSSSCHRALVRQAFRISRGHRTGVRRSSHCPVFLQSLSTSPSLPLLALVLPPSLPDPACAQTASPPSRRPSCTALSSSSSTRSSCVSSACRARPSLKRCIPRSLSHPLLQRALLPLPLVACLAFCCCLFGVACTLSAMLLPVSLCTLRANAAVFVHPTPPSPRASSSCPSRRPGDQRTGDPQRPARYSPPSGVHGVPLLLPLRRILQGARSALIPPMVRADCLPATTNSVTSAAWPILGSYQAPRKLPHLPRPTCSSC